MKPAGAIDRRSLLSSLAVLPAVSGALFPASTQAQLIASQPSQKPNVVFILADNVGYGDLGPYGGGELRGAPTPRIDQLAREGLRLTQFLVEPACTPSRAALLTGRYSIREGLSLILVPNGPNTLSARSVTMGNLVLSAQTKPERRRPTRNLTSLRKVTTPCRQTQLQPGKEHSPRRTPEPIGSTCRRSAPTPA